MGGWVGDPPENLKLALYCDSDFAGDPETMRSTSGVLLALRGPRTFCPLDAISKRRMAVSHSTPEAEIVAARRVDHRAADDRPLGGIRGQPGCNQDPRIREEPNAEVS